MATCLHYSTNFLEVEQLLLILIQDRTKWQSTKSKITKGTMVINKEENVPFMKRQLGRVTDVIPGKGI